MAYDTLTFPNGFLSVSIDNFCWMLAANKQIFQILFPNFQIMQSGFFYHFSGTVFPALTVLCPRNLIWQLVSEAR